jgi:hypothetical protein
MKKITIYKSAYQGLYLFFAILALPPHLRLRQSTPLPSALKHDRDSECPRLFPAHSNMTATKIERNNKVTNTAYQCLSSTLKSSSTSTCLSLNNNNHSSTTTNSSKFWRFKRLPGSMPVSQNSFVGVFSCTNCMFVFTGKNKLK